MPLMTLRQYMTARRISEGSLYYLKKKSADTFPRPSGKRQRNEFSRQMDHVYDEDELTCYLSQFDSFITERGNIVYSRKIKPTTPEEALVSLAQYAKSHRSINGKSLATHEASTRDFPKPRASAIKRLKSGWQRQGHLYQLGELDAFRAQASHRPRFDNDLAQVFIRKPITQLHGEYA